MFVSWYLHTSSSSFWWPFGSFHTYCILLVLLVLCTILLHTVSLFGDYVSWPHFTLHTYIHFFTKTSRYCLTLPVAIEHYNQHQYTYLPILQIHPGWPKLCKGLSFITFTLKKEKYCCSKQAVYDKRKEF